MARNRHLYPTGVMVAVILGSLVFLELLQPPGAACGQACVKSSEAPLAPTANERIASLASPPLIVPRPSSATWEEPLQATTEITHTRFLPLVFMNHWLSPVPPFGVQVFMINPARTATLQELGTSWIRTPLVWSEIERKNTQPEKYQWPNSFDREIAKLSSRNVRIIMTLLENPSWAATYPQGPVDKVPISELVEFMVAAVKHYGAEPYRVKYWEFYNEPDNGNEIYAQRGFGFFGNQPEAYAQMLAAVYPAMKAADPEAQILMGGLAYDNWVEDGGVFVRGFLDGVLQHGGGAYFDVMNFHYYLPFRARWEPYGMGLIGKAAYLRQKLASYGLDKPIACTESSQVSDALHGGSDELQSRYIVQLFTWAKAGNIDPTIWFMLTDEQGSPSWDYGLFDVDLNPKPSSYAFKTLSQQLSPARYVRTLSSGETGSAQIVAYEFLTLNLTTRIIVAWTTDESDHPMLLQTSRVVVVDKFGATTTINDSDDGKSDGRVQVTIGPSPVYLRIAR